MFTRERREEEEKEATGFNPLVGMIVVHTEATEHHPGHPRGFNPLVGMIVVHTPTGRAKRAHIAEFQSPCRDDRCSHGTGRGTREGDTGFNPLVGMIVVHTSGRGTEERATALFQSPCRDDRCSHRTSGKLASNYTTQFSPGPFGSF